MTAPKQWWMTPIDPDAPPGVRPEFATHPKTDVLATRRTFLKAAGFSFAGLAAANCRPAPQNALPQLRQPELTPGRGYSYASTCGACETRCGLLVTTHDGRPTKIEGNPDHPLSGGAVCAVGQAAILGLYDSERLAWPMRQGKRATWAEVDADLSARLAQVTQQGGAVRILTGTINSPTTTALIADVVAAFPGARHVVYDPISTSAVAEAFQQTHGARLLPHYRFDRAVAIVGIDADFLGTWISPVEFTRGYASGRHGAQSVDGAYHAQVESRLTITGSKADRRLRAAPGDMGHIATQLASRLASRAGAEVTWPPSAPAVSEPKLPAALDEIADRLWSARGHALVVSGSQDVRVQVMCNYINHLIDAYGTTIELDRPSFQRQGSDADLMTLRGELARGAVAALVIAGVNPVYDLPDGAALAGDLRKVPLLVSVAERLDETARLAHVVCPDHHYLESWGDAEPVSGLVSLSQPAIQPLHDTRALVETLAVWAGKPGSAYDLVRAHWEQAIYPRAGATDPFPTFWNRTLEHGVAEVMPVPREVAAFNAAAVHPVDRETGAAGGLALVLYPKVSMLDGRHAHNAWLQELPDPLTKVVWDNYACVSPATARRLGLEHGDVVRVAAGASGVELPAFIQPGQHDGVVAVALGYGRAGTDRFTRIGPPWIGAQPPAGLVGQNAAPLVDAGSGFRRYDGRRVEVTKTGRTHRLASTQTHQSLDVPGAVTPYGGETTAIVQEITHKELAADAGEAHEGHGELWPPDHRYEGHRWGMAVDLDACTGCSACVIACQAENNIPVVGQDEVARSREMHWLRIDRYYAGEDGDVDVAFQPMMCQHCEQAPCEVVCPVLATVHSSEGLNEQVYNRCVGTLYCANNCPYKVRRFNWFDYPHEDALQNLVLNPNVTVRSRGVMEKCTMCVQRIEDSKIEARRQGTPIADGTIKTACQQTCPAEAIVFGDLNDPKSRVAALSADRRAYRVLEELNVRPAVRYLKLVRHE